MTVLELSLLRNAELCFPQRCSLDKWWDNAAVFRSKDKGILKKLLQNCLCLSATTKAYLKKSSLAGHNGVVFCNVFSSWWSAFCPNQCNFKTTFSLCYIYWCFFKGSLMLKIIPSRVLNFTALLLMRMWFYRFKHIFQALVCVSKVGEY